LSFDACIYHFQLPQVASLARAFPDTLIILDHIGSPLGIGPYQGRRDEALAEWRGLIGEAAASPNVVVKLGGQGMWLAGVDWPRPPDSEAMAATFGDLFHRTIEAFGPERCMFESNFPVDRHTSSYATLWNMLKRIGAAYSEAERTAMFYGVADRVYRLGLP